MKCVAGQRKNISAIPSAITIGSTPSVQCYLFVIMHKVAQVVGPFLRLCA